MYLHVKVMSLIGNVCNERVISCVQDNAFLTSTCLAKVTLADLIVNIGCLRGKLRYSIKKCGETPCLRIIKLVYIGEFSGWWEKMDDRKEGVCVCVCVCVHQVGKKGVYVGIELEAKWLMHITIVLKCSILKWLLFTSCGDLWTSAQSGVSSCW